MLKFNIELPLPASETPEKGSTKEGSIPMPAERLSTKLTPADRFCGFLCRLGSFRNRYRISPGLYRIGDPDAESPVIVTSNYRLTVDILRTSLVGRDLWVLVLDTLGINVWCAAGKGIFGTRNLVGAIRNPGQGCPPLEDIVSHRLLVLPQLGAPGIAAHEVMRETGFRVIYGPVLAHNLPVFLDGTPLPPGHLAKSVPPELITKPDAGCAILKPRGRPLDPTMRRVPFELRDRIVLIPIEIGNALRFSRKWLLRAMGISTLAALAGGRGLPGALAAVRSLLRAYTAALLGGAVATPALLPWLPGRWFSVKGLVTGILAAAMGFPAKRQTGDRRKVRAEAWTNSPSEAEAWGLRILTAAGSSFLALQFTGATPFTGPSGVSRELSATARAYAISLATAALLFFGGLLRNSSEKAGSEK